MTQRRVRDGLYGYGLLVVILACMAACSRSSEVPIRRATGGITLKSKPLLKGVDLLLLIDASEKFLTTLQPTNPAHFLAARFAKAAHQRVSQEMVDDDLYAKELRRVNVELVIPLTNWTHYEEMLAHYQEDHRVPANTLVHIYREI